MTFEVGDRVVVSKPCNSEQNGYYGHVVSIDPGAHDHDAYTVKGAYIRVAFRGHINSASSDPYYLGFDDNHPFPCAAFELEHAD